jgi:hypothetical protein
MLYNGTAVLDRAETDAADLAEFARRWRAQAAGSVR